MSLKRKISFKHFLHHTLLIVHCTLLVATFFSCSEEEVPFIEPEEVKELPIVNVDSIFIRLDKDLIEKKAESVDNIFKNLRRRVGFNGTVLYAEQGRIIYNKAWGFRNVRKRTDSLQAKDRFQLSSVSKMFTAEAVMMLKNEGKIDYDVDIREYIPEWPYEGITTRLLLNHRSGLSRYESLNNDGEKDARN